MSEKSFAAISVAAAIVWGTFFYPPAKAPTATPVPKAAVRPAAQPVMAAQPAPGKPPTANPGDYPDPGTERGGRTASLGLARP